jgi:hypothetical protein
MWITHCCQPSATYCLLSYLASWAKDNDQSSDFIILEDSHISMG